MIDQNIWTLLLTYSFVQGYLLAIYVLLKLKRFYLFGAIVIPSTLILSYLYERFDWYLDFPELIWAAAPLWYLWGPLLYFFTKRQFGLKIKVLEFLMHCIPFGIFLIYIAPFYFLNNQEKIEIFEQVFSVETYSGDLNHYIFSLHILLYVYFSIRLYKSMNTKQKTQTSDTNIVFNEVNKNILQFYFIYGILSFIIYIAIDLFHKQFNVLYPINYLLFSTIIHLITYYTIIKNGNAIAIIDNIKYTSSSLNDNTSILITEKVQSYLSKKDHFSNPNLRLNHVSKDLDIPSHHISQSINSILNKSFFDLVNEYRVSAVKLNLTNPKYANYTISAIAYEFGFKSPSSFYRVFKQFTGQTPKEFMESRQ